MSIEPLNELVEVIVVSKKSMLSSIVNLFKIIAVMVIVTLSSTGSYILYSANLSKDKIVANVGGSHTVFFMILATVLLLLSVFLIRYIVRSLAGTSVDNVNSIKQKYIKGVVVKVFKIIGSIVTVAFSFPSSLAFCYVAINRDNEVYKNPESMFVVCVLMAIVLMILSLKLIKYLFMSFSEIAVYYGNNVKKD